MTGRAFEDSFFARAPLRYMAQKALGMEPVWEHCERIENAISPEDMDRKVKEMRGDIVDALTSMGAYRQKHVKKFKAKLQRRESDPANWNWYVEALGEVSHTGSIPKAFWAIYRRGARAKKESSKARPVMLHHDISRMVEETAYMPRLPAPPPPAPMHTLSAPQQMLSLPAPHQQFHQTVPAQGAQSAHPSQYYAQAPAQASQPQQHQHQHHTTNAQNSPAKCTTG